MSLLNDMLRDLSHTQKNVENMPVSALEVQQSEQRQLLNQSSVIKTEPGKLWPSVAVFLVVLMSLWAWKQGAWQAKDEQNVESAPAVNDRSLAAQGDALVGAAVTPENMKINTVPANVFQSVTSEPIDPAMVLNERLAALETAITKLSSAVEESPLLTSDNAVTRYPGTEHVAAENVSTETLAVVTEQQASVRIRDPFVPDEQSNQTEHQTVDVGKSISATVADNSIPAGAHLSVKPNPVFMDQREAERGRQLAEQGQTSDAIIALQAFIANAQTPNESTRALLDIFTEQENVVAIENLLAQAEYLSLLDKQFYAAKVAIIQQHEDQAIKLLEARVTEAEEREAYRALLAGLYQRAGKYAEAATAYRRLLGSFGDKPSYWLGLALAQDSLSQRQTARQAYLRVAEYADLQPEVRAYIQQRLLALQ